MTTPCDAFETAQCAEVGDPDLWFSADHSQRALAVSICGACPVQDRCLATALRLHPIAGIWAGTTQVDRERMLLLAAISDQSGHSVQPHAMLLAPASTG